MGMDRYVGRVGALAVALGIGSAVAAMPGVAWAEPDSAPSQTSTGTPARDTASAQKPDSAGISKDRTKRPASDRDTGTRSDAAEARRAKRHALATRNAAKKDDHAVVHGDVDTPTRPSRLGARVDSPGSATAPDTTPTPTSASEALPTATPPAQDAAASRAPRFATVMQTLFSPRVLPPRDREPEAPAATPLLWTMLAAARRHAGVDTASATTGLGSLATSASSAAVQASAVSPQLPGGPRQSPVIAPDGTVYQVTTTVNADIIVTVLDRDGQVLHTTEPFTGYISADAVVRPDGTLIVFSSNQRGTRSTITQVDNQGVVTTLARIRGEQNDDPVLVGADGSLYFRTRVPFGLFDGSLPDRYYRLSPANVARTFPYYSSVDVTPDGTAYVVTRQFGASTFRVIDTNGVARSVLIPYGSTPSDPIVGDDGYVYVTAGVTAFGLQKTRLYTANATSTTIRTITGLPGDTVVTPGGVYLETHTYPGSTDDGTGTTYISAITATDVVTSEGIDGRIPPFAGYAETTGAFQVAPNGTVFVPVNTSTGGGAVAIVDTDGAVTVTALPGTVMSLGRTIRVHGAGTQSADSSGYVNYTADGNHYVAVLGTDGTISRTLALPEGYVGTSLFFGPDGAAYELLTDDKGTVIDPGDDTQVVLALSTGTYLPTLTSSQATVEFGPDGTGYVLGNTGDGGLNIIGFNGAGDVVVPVTNIASAESDNDINLYPVYLSFAPDGTAYATDRSYDQPGVYALTSTGRVAVVNGFARRPVFSSDGTGYVAVSSNQGGVSGTTVTTFETD
jgi:hypothetical protein